MCVDINMGICINIAMGIDTDRDIPRHDMDTGTNIDIDINTDIKKNIHT